MLDSAHLRIVRLLSHEIRRRSGALAGALRMPRAGLIGHTTSALASESVHATIRPEMPAPRETIKAAVARVAAYCEQRSTDDYKIEHAVRGASITILERRPPWNPAFGSEWSSLKVAQLRYDDAARRWRLFSSGSDDRWHPYELAPPAPDVAPLLVAIEEDGTGIFWG